MSLPALRPAWWMVLWGLISTLSLSLALPAFGYSAADYNPLHQHVVAGAGSTSERSQALAEHTHGGAPASSPSGKPGSELRTISVPDTVAAVGGTAPGIGHLLFCPACAAYWLAALDAAASTPPALWQRLTTIAIFGAWLGGPPPLQPPR